LGKVGAITAALCAFTVLAPVNPAQAMPAPLSHSEAASRSHVITGSSCPTSAPGGTLTEGSDSIGVVQLCERAVAEAATPQAKRAIRAAFHMLGAPYACGDIGRTDSFRFDCSSLVARAYQIGAGIPAAGATWSASTRDMLPWDGRPLASWATFITAKSLKPGDLVLYDTRAKLSRHVVMYLGHGLMLHTNYCGGVARVASFWGTNPNGSHSFAVARRVVMPNANAPRPADYSNTAAARATEVSYSRFLKHDVAATVRIQMALNKVVRVGQTIDGKWNGGLFAGIVGFRRVAYGSSGSAATYSIDWATMKELGRRAGYKLVA